VANNLKSPEHLDEKSEKLLNELQLKGADVSKVVSLVSPPQLPPSMPVNFYKYENKVTVTGLARLLRDNRSGGLVNGLSCSVNETEDSFLADLVIFLFWFLGA
jgi:hypothetical protein